MDLNQLTDIFQNKRFRFQNEADLQRGIEKVLLDANVSFKREFIVNPKDRLDFLIDDIGVEIKIKGSSSDVIKQLWRYAKLENIKGLLLLTTKLNHRIPNIIHDKPVKVLYLNNGF